MMGPAEVPWRRSAVGLSASQGSLGDHYQYSTASDVRAPPDGPARLSRDSVSMLSRRWVWLVALVLAVACAAVAPGAVSRVTRPSAISACQIVRAHGLVGYVVRINRAVQGCARGRRVVADWFHRDRTQHPFQIAHIRWWCGYEGDSRTSASCAARGNRMVEFRVRRTRT